MIADLLSWPTTWSGAFTAVAAMILFGGPISYAIVRYFGGRHEEPQNSSDNPTSQTLGTVPAIEPHPAPIQLTNPHPDTLEKDRKRIEYLTSDVARLTALNTAKDAELAKCRAEIARLKPFESKPKRQYKPGDPAPDPTQTPLY